MNNDAHDFTRGPILPKLIRFSVPVLFALLLQATYGAVDLMVVGQFATSADVSAVATGSNIMLTLTGPLSSFAMGITVLLGRQIGSGEGKKSGSIIGAGLTLFLLLGAVLTILLVGFPDAITTVMQAPKEAFSQTSDYVRICGAGVLVIVAYNLIGSIFRGIGDSKTPLIAVLIACIFNVAGDLFLVAVCGLGAKGAAIATVAAQGIISAFCVRVPVSWLMSRIRPVSLFYIGLATPCSSLLQIFMCLACLAWLKKRNDYRIADHPSAGLH